MLNNICLIQIKKIHFSSGLKNSYRAALASKSMDQGAYVYSDVTMQNTGPDGQFSEEHHSYSEMPATNFRLRGLKQEIKVNLITVLHNAYSLKLYITTRYCIGLFI